MTIEILGYKLFSLGPAACASDIAKNLSITNKRKPLYAACLNPHSFVVSQHDHEFAHAIKLASHILPDGVGVTLASKLLRTGRLHRITGHDLFTSLSTTLNDKGPFKAAFIGSTTETLNSIAERYQRDYPNATISALYSPPFADPIPYEATRQILETLAKERPEVVWVGMTAPKQEKWIAAHYSELSCSFVGAIGAVFDYYAGNIPRAPKLMRNSGLEWTVRLALQPRKIWRRVFISGPQFFWAASRWHRRARQNK